MNGLKVHPEPVLWSGTGNFIFQFIQLLSCNLQVAGRRKYGFRYNGPHSQVSDYPNLLLNERVFLTTGWEKNCFAISLADLMRLAIDPTFLTNYLTLIVLDGTGGHSHSLWQLIHHITLNFTLDQYKKCYISAVPQLTNPAKHAH